MAASLGEVITEKDYSSCDKSFIDHEKESYHSSEMDLFRRGMLSINGNSLFHERKDYSFSVNGSYKHPGVLTEMKNRIDEKESSYSILWQKDTDSASVTIYIQPYKPAIGSNADRKAVADMQSWVFRNAQRKWGMTSAECAEVFKKYNIYKFISDCYGLLHVSSYNNALEDVETLLRNKGVAV